MGDFEMKQCLFVGDPECALNQNLSVVWRRAYMKIIGAKQIGQTEDPVRAKIAKIIPVLKATLHSLAQIRIERLGGLEKITLRDLARESREGHGDAGICFEYAIHDAIAKASPLIHQLASEVLEDLCKIKGGAESLLFGPEKERVIPILESVQNALTDESVVWVGNPGRPPKLKAYVSKIMPLLQSVWVDLGLSLGGQSERGFEFPLADSRFRFLISDS